MADTGLYSLGQEYQKYKNKGLQLDEKEKQEKKELLTKIVEQLGLPGIAAANILSVLGKPDELTPVLQKDVKTASLLPGPVMDSKVDSNSNLPPFYFVYYLGSKSEYYYFKIDAVKETVITSDWKNDD
ncbi:hypothetical protein BJ944DRAFT_290269 [Cunninghamella echinulata]|nr:hypothetical protein BJ944DRAFT_290269 [Cunninghamella echinulata]